MTRFYGRSGAKLLSKVYKQFKLPKIPGCCNKKKLQKQIRISVLFAAVIIVVVMLFL